MHTYIHKVHYYETDKMGITHHSNYIRWMEEARMSFLSGIGYGMKKLEADGITSPVVSLQCQYRHTTTYDDAIEIQVRVEDYSGVRLQMGYTMINMETGQVVMTASSCHCFIDGNGRPVPVKKRFPGFDAALRSQIPEA